jgi:hypothetical protein
VLTSTIKATRRMGVFRGEMGIGVTRFSALFPLSSPEGHWLTTQWRTHVHGITSMARDRFGFGNNRKGAAAIIHNQCKRSPQPARYLKAFLTVVILASA